MTRLVGLTWDHPRGRAALEAATDRAAASGFELTWETQSLEGFESAPIDDLARRYDLIVMDHPHLGDALTAACLQPMEQVIGADAVTDIEGRAVGPSLASYRMDGSTWALPLDAATQVSARRPDLVSEEPRTWADVIDLARRHPVALSLSGPHAYLSFASICRSFDAPLAQASADTIVDPAAGEQALDILRALGAKAPAGSETQNPIALLERMTSTDDIAFIPLVYGYVNYANRRRPHALSFGPPPEGHEGVTGSTIGGTGIAVTRRATVTDGLREHLLWLLSDQTQTGHIPLHQGQPSVRAAWEDEAVNGPVGDFYRRTRMTIDSAWVRPRFAGFTALQSELSRVLREAVSSAEPAAAVLARLTALQNTAADRAASSEREGIAS